ncbi:hypothetical protein ACH5AL_24510 [Actinacidiphila glaucinigra]|uniref:hypothetical protein n=1 Tax=Actinacidiphila glaucinigra TaxID=235986 RepID=UPI0037BD68B7
MRMTTTELCEAIALIAGAGDADDALDLSRRLAQDNAVGHAVAVRRTVKAGELDVTALLKVGDDIADEAARWGIWARGELLAVAREMAASGGDNVITRAGRQMASLF